MEGLEELYHRFGPNFRTIIDEKTLDPRYLCISLVLGSVEKRKVNTKRPQGNSTLK